VQLWLEMNTHHTLHVSHNHHSVDSPRFHLCTVELHSSLGKLLGWVV
jgi:hypothetical protein